MGYKDIVGGHSNPECTHVILTKAEYEKLLQQISDAQREVRMEKECAEQEIRKTEQRADARIGMVQSEAAQAIEDLEEALAAEQEESAYQRGLNATLLRISRERANADRKLARKKVHTGYVVTYSSEKEYRYRLNYGETGSVMLWETVIQSPYSADFEEQQVRKQIWGELFHVHANHTWKIGRLGLNGYVNEKYETLLCRPDWKRIYEPRNVLLLSETKLRLNFNRLYWEVVIQHTKPLGVVPPDMRAK